MASTDTYVDIHGPAFEVKKAGGKVEGRYFTVKTYSKGTYLSCTLWDNKHAHVELNNGDIVSVNGKLTKSNKDGKEYLNVSVYRIAVTPMDSGVDDRVPTANGDSSDEPDVL
jgi:hypothetical protein